MESLLGKPPGPYSQEELLKWGRKTGVLQPHWAPTHTKPERIFRTLILLKEVNCLAQGHREREGKRQNLNPGLKKPLPILSVCLPELPLIDLVRVAIFFHLLIFSKILHLLPPKRKLHPYETHLALSHILLRPLPLNSGRDWAECLCSLKQHFSWGKQRTTSSEFPEGGRGQVKYGDFWPISDPLD